MSKLNRTTLLTKVVLLSMIFMLMSACQGQKMTMDDAKATLTAQANQPTQTATPITNIEAAVKEALTQTAIAAGPVANLATAMPTAGILPTSTLAPMLNANGTPPPTSCKEQMLGPWQPPSTHEYWYVQVNTEFVDSDYLISLWYENEDLDLSGWLVSNGTGDPKGTEIVYTVRTSIKEVQFANPTSGVGWRLCAHPDAQLGAEAHQHAVNIAAQRSWLRVYDVGDLWMSLQTGDAELIELIKCITPPTQGIPDCHTP